MTRWTPAPFVGGAYSDDSKEWSAQDTVNYIVVNAERQGTRSPTKLRGVPGMVLFADLGTDAPIRGAHNCEGLLLVVSGRSLFKVDPRGASTLIGTIPGASRVSMAHNQYEGGYQVAIANGTGGYVYNTLDDSLVQITDEGFPGAISFDYVDSYITGIEPGKRFAFTSQLADATDYNTLDRQEAEGSPDLLVGQLVTHREWWLFSKRSIEPYVNTGANTGTFQRVSGVFIERGAASTHCMVALDNAPFWVGDDGVVYRANGYTPQRISTVAIEHALAQCDLSSCFAFTFEDEGHKVYYVTCPDGQTWGYDVQTQEWHRRQSYGLNRWRVSTLTKWNDRWIAGDYANGKLYMLDWNVQAEGDQVLERRRITGVMSDTENALIVNAIRLVVDTGKPTAIPPPPKLYLVGNLLDGFVSQTVDFHYVARNNIGSTVFDISSGALPDGLSMDSSGHVTGAYTTSGPFSWTVRGVTSSGQRATLQDGNSVTSEMITHWKMVNDGSTKASSSSACADGIIFIGRSSGYANYTLDQGSTWNYLTGLCAGWDVANVRKFEGNWYLVSNNTTGASCAGDSFAFTDMANPPSAMQRSMEILNGKLYVGAYAADTSSIIRMNAPGAPWTTISTGFTYGDIAFMCEAAGSFFFTTTSGKILKSTDLATFTLAFDTADLNLRSICYLPSLGIVRAFSTTASYYSSDGGVTWTTLSGQQAAFSSATKTMFFGGDTHSIVYTSVDNSTFIDQIHSGSYQCVDATSDGTLAVVPMLYQQLYIGTS